MKKLHFNISIEASAEEVFRSMLGIDDIELYKQWTAIFNPTSTYEGRWEKGEKMLFTGTDEHGKKGGMVSEIADIRTNQFVSIRHLGMLDGEHEIMDGEEVEKWTGIKENYSFLEVNGITQVSVEIDVVEEYLDYFNTTWPKALEKLKEILEQ